ncbi:hypothetical protein N7520_003590 [Penicillium odoratum]|uniref:uncharacterized protein n=1 Tax=Penicillium odoratum TaxID=1167516 RepID=UPI0025495B5E|nr:uncharacterized protein N7520_003590 [Penicillium odoratum]KAJ5769031.1 hypothetical protein N7520_003590 [Penicillium odoratum]
MADDSLPQGEVVGIIIGAVALFSLISFIPMALMWYHRRRDTSRRASETAVLTSSMQQVSVQQWLEEHNSPGDPANYSQDMCLSQIALLLAARGNDIVWGTPRLGKAPICLSSLSSSAYLSSPESVHLPHNSRHQSPVPPDETLIPDSGNENRIIVLSHCHHAFHSTCLTSWFEYRHYKCPICQASYSPSDSV